MKGQVLSASDKEKRIVRARKLLKQLTANKLNRTFFNYEKVFKVQDYRNSQNCRVYAPCNQKRSEILDSRLYSCRTGFSKSVMVSIGVSKLDKASLVLIEEGAKINQEYYCSHVLTSVIPEMDNLAENDYVFMQDGGRSHTAKPTVEYLNSHVPEVIKPDSRPANSPDLNPKNYYYCHD